MESTNAFFAAGLLRRFPFTSPPLLLRNGMSGVRAAFLFSSLTVSPSGYAVDCSERAIRARLESRRPFVRFAPDD